jgi:phenylacetate-CoA ligase
MSIRNIITEKMLLPLSDKALGRSISTHLAFLEKSQWWSAEELEQFQNKRLKIVIEHAYNNVPYYRQVFDNLGLTPKDIQTKADLVKLPILKKDDIRKNFPHAIVDKKLQKGTYNNGSTSGSTGEPLKYYLSKEAYSFNIACGLRAWQMHGYRLGDSYIKASQNQRKTTEKKLQDKVMNNHYLYLKNIDRNTLNDAIKTIEEVKPTVIRCYPDPLEFLADEILANKINPKVFRSLKAIATTGNVLHDKARLKIEKAFNTRVFDGYSCEGSPPFFECETHTCYHGAMEYGISEFIDVTDSKDGLKQGRHIVTNLWNLATPFIRYDSQDELEWDENHTCTCGRNLIAIKRILGRDNDILTTPNGKKIIVHIFTIFFSKTDSVSQFQVIQETPTEVSLNLVVKDNYDSEEETKIRTFCREVFDDETVAVHVKIVDAIIPSANGKRRFLINKCN